MEVSLYVCIGVGSEGGGDSPPPPPSFDFTHCLHNELHCSIVDCIACRHCSSRKSHFCCLKKNVAPTSSYAYGMYVCMYVCMYVRMYACMCVCGTWWCSGLCIELMIHVSWVRAPPLADGYYPIFFPCLPPPPPVHPAVNGYLA